MKVVLHPHTPAEKRLLSAFINDLADLQEVERSQGTANLRSVLSQIGNERLAQPPVDNDHVAEGCEKFEEPAPAKKSRAKKTPSATGAEPVVESGSPSAPAEEGNDPAPTASAEDGGSTEATADAPASPAHTHDELRKIFAALTQAGKGDLAIKELGKLGHTSIKGIPADKLDEAHTVMAAL